MEKGGIITMARVSGVVSSVVTACYSVWPETASNTTSFMEPSSAL